MAYIKWASEIVSEFGVELVQVTLRTGKGSEDTEREDDQLKK
jgi:hypothetical protein